jgi:isoleucyl-tRNA synthetase
MKGFHVPRIAGWDCHGLPVELEVEKRLGLSGKADIERYGVEAFNAACRESVGEHVETFTRMTERMGYWVDTDAAYWTLDPSYIESVWWSLKQIFDAGLLAEDHRVTPYCPRCGTGLSDHEVAQGYLDVTDPSVYVRFPLTGGPWAGRASLLIWTTTPWTLISNTAVAVNPSVDYGAYAIGDETLIVAQPLAAGLFGDDVTFEPIRGADMEHWTYQRPFDSVEIPGAHFVGLADYVTVEDGTGLVHQAPAFGADDLVVARRYGLPVVNPVRPDGTFEPDLPLVGGQFFKQADRDIVTDLDARGLLWRETAYTHAYPHCWRCDTALIYYALPSWYVRTTARKSRLVEENERTTWHPATIKHGRYGDWLDNNIDWALSRDRYWGTPLPIWRCTADGSHLTCVASLAELAELAGRDLSGVDPHRPFIDEVTLTCPQCGTEALRVPQVIDCWYDAGSMPFAQHGYPHRPGSEEAFAAAYPADYIAEGLDQTRGWFYTLMTIGTLVFDRSAYDTVLCLGIILAEDGRRMSKHLGNILDPFELMYRHGADALRWFMLASGNPWAARRVGHDALDEVVRKVLLTVWNTASFHVLYANAGGWEPGVAEVAPPADRPLLDRWALSRLHATVRDVDAALEGFDPTTAGRRVAELVDDLSNWYVRRSRRRFWDGDPAALTTLHECLTTITRLLAPFTPFLADELHERLVADLRADAAGGSVHLQRWPVTDVALLDPVLDEQVALVRRLVELGRAARAGSAVKTRQPLGRALVASPGWDALPGPLRLEVADELNVRALESLTGAGDLVDVSVRPQFRALGRRFAQRTKPVADAIAAADAASLVTALRADGRAWVEVDGEPVDVSPDDVQVNETPREGWAVSASGADTVALDLELTDELRRAGVARDVVRAVQDARKAAGLHVSDRIELWWEADSDGLEAAALREAAAQLAGEVLAVTVEEGGPAAPVQRHAALDGRVRFWLRAVD